MWYFPSRKNQVDSSTAVKSETIPFELEPLPSSSPVSAPDVSMADSVEPVVMPPVTISQTASPQAMPMPQVDEILSQGQSVSTNSVEESIEADFKDVKDIASESNVG